jgi:hypothetical protein
MIAVVRAVAWIVGSLSVAVLFRQGFGSELAPAVRPVLDSFAWTVQSVFSVVEAPINAFILPHVAALAGTGPVLLAHWPYVFLIALLHMWPRPSASGGMDALQWGQALGAVVLAFAGTLIVGAGPLLADLGNVVVAMFAICALAVNWMPEWPTKGGMVEYGDDDLQVPLTVFAWLFLLVAMGIGGVTVVAGFATADEVQAQLPIALAMTFLIWSVGFFVDTFVRSPPFPGRKFREAPVTHLARLALFVLACLVSLAFAQGPVLTTDAGWLLLVAGFVAGTAIALIPRLLRGEEEVQFPPPPALGVFLLGGTAIMVVNHYLR